MAAQALTGPGLRGGPIEVGTHSGHGVADSAGRGRARHGGKQDDPRTPQKWISDRSTTRSAGGVQRGDEGGADEGECEHVDVPGHVQDRKDSSDWDSLKLGSSYPPKSRLQPRFCSCWDDWRG